MRDPRPTRIGQRHIADEAGVSIATVSNSLNRPEIVAPETLERVREAMARLGFVRNEAAASLKRGSNRLIGLVVPDITNPFYSEIARGVVAAADASGYGVVLCNSDDDAGTEMMQFETLAQLRAVGALVIPLTADTERLSRLRAVGTRLVLVDRVATEHDCCSVAVDDVLGGEIAARHLLATTRGRLVLVNGPSHIPQCADRRRGFMNAVAQAKGAPREAREIVVDDMTVQAGRAAVSALLTASAESHEEPPGGMFCVNDQLATGAVGAVRDHGFEVPTTVRVIGYGNLSISSDGLIPLTTVDQPKNALGHEAVRLLLDEIVERGTYHEHVQAVYRPSLVIRDSAP